MDEIERPSKMGRPTIPIDQETFERLCQINATLMEISGWFKCSEDTIENWCKKTYGITFSECFKRFASEGKISLRRKMFQGALGGNPTLMIWLSKQHLGMSDKVEQASSIEVKALSPKEVEAIIVSDPFGEKKKLE